ncbi:YlbG family protein [Ligilactobacillus ceti]|nr:YlbG family protein [Ligilactobacillus ceti]
MEFEIQERQGLVVYVYHLRQSKQLRKYGDIHYVSRKMKYVILYLNQEDFPETMEKINKLRFVRKVEKSKRNELVTNFDQTLGIYKLTDEDREKYKNKSDKK